MKQIYVISALVLAIGSSFAVHAKDAQTGKDEETLHVTAKINAPVCDFEMANRGEVEFGAIAPGILNATAVTAGAIVPVAGNFTVKCTGKTLTRIEVKDAYADALWAGKHSSLFAGRHGPSGQFGLVDDSTQQLVGSYIITPTITTVTDGVIANKNLYVQGGDHTGVFLSTKSDSVRDQQTLVLQDRNGFYTNDINVDYKIEPQFLPRNDWNASSADVNIVGEVAFSMVYL